MKVARNYTGKPNIIAFDVSPLLHSCAASHSCAACRCACCGSYASQATCAVPQSLLCWPLAPAAPGCGSPPASAAPLPCMRRGRTTGARMGPWPSQQARQCIARPSAPSQAVRMVLHCTAEQYCYSLLCIALHGPSAVWNTHLCLMCCCWPAALRCPPSWAAGVVTAPYPYCLHCKTRQAAGGLGYEVSSAGSFQAPAWQLLSRCAHSLPAVGPPDIWQRLAALPGLPPFALPVPALPPACLQVAPNVPPLGKAYAQRQCCGGPLEALEWML